MPGFDVDVSDLRRLQIAFDEIPPRVGAKLSQAIRKTARDIEASAKRRAPVDTGNLRNSISSTIQGTGNSKVMSAEIGPTAEYGIYVELGTSRMGPQPYMQPALEENIPAFESVVSSVLGGRLLP